MVQCTVVWHSVGMSVAVCSDGYCGLHVLLNNQPTSSRTSTRGRASEGTPTASAPIEPAVFALDWPLALPVVEPAPPTVLLTD